MARISIRLMDQPLELETRPGLFSPEHVDRGTLAMLSVAALEPGMRVMDLGCGCGVVGILAAKRCGEDNVLLTDVDPLAVETASQSLPLEGMAQATLSCRCAAIHLEVARSAG